MRVEPEWLPNACGGSKRSKPATLAPRRASSMQANDPIEPSPTTATSKIRSAPMAGSSRICRRSRVGEAEFLQQLADASPLLHLRRRARPNHLVSLVLEDAHLPALSGDVVETGGGKFDDPFVVRVDHIARPDSYAANLDRLVDGFDAERAMMDRFAARIDSERDGHETGDIAYAAIRYRADAAHAVKVFTHPVPEHALVVRPATHGFYHPDHRFPGSLHLLELLMVSF